MRWLALVLLAACGGVGVDETIDFEAVKTGTVTFKCADLPTGETTWEPPPGWFSIMVGRCGYGRCIYSSPYIEDGLVKLTCEDESVVVRYASGVGIILDGSSGATTAAE